MNNKIKIHALVTPYSSVVGGGVQLLDTHGRPRFLLAPIGTTDGITKEENRAIANRIAELINQHGLEVPQR